MSICCCFGHKFIYDDQVKEKLKEALRFVIKNKKINEFYVGHNGSFDFLCANCLKELKQEFS